MIGALVSAGYEPEGNPEEADVVIVNTCGFITSAKEESIEAILQAAQLKGGKCQSLIVVGCLAQRYGSELSREIPEVDAFLGVGHNDELVQIVEKTLAGSKMVDYRPPGMSWSETNRVRSTPPWTAYLKIADGCNNRCSYCAIPDIRGEFRSRPPEMVIAEAEKLASEGVLEVNLIGQDITRYGEDIDGWSLERLAKEIAKIDGFHWIRLLYCYPTRITDGLIELVASEPKICKYMDIPLQHGDDKVLAAMNRRGSRKEYLDLVRKLRSASPEIALRTSIIVGFPSEGDQEFENLLSFVKEIQFDRMGAFTYSVEEGTPAAEMSNQVPEEVAEERYDKLMRLAAEISLKRNRELIGKEIDVLAEAPDSGRSYRDAIEIDGIVKLVGGEAKPGTIIRATVIEADEYDLTASIKL